MIRFSNHFRQKFEIRILMAILEEDDTLPNDIILKLWSKDYIEPRLPYKLEILIKHTITIQLI